MSELIREIAKNIVNELNGVRYSLPGSITGLMELLSSSLNTLTFVFILRSSVIVFCSGQEISNKEFSELYCADPNGFSMERVLELAKKYADLYQGPGDIK